MKLRNISVFLFVILISFLLSGGVLANEDDREPTEILSSDAAAAPADAMPVIMEESTEAISPDISEKVYIDQDVSIDYEETVLDESMFVLQLDGVSTASQIVE